MRRHLLPLLALTPLVGCADSGSKGHGDGPYVESMSKSRLVIGEELLFTGRHFLDRDQGATRLTFHGTFRPDQGDPQPVNFTITPAIESTDGDVQVLRWSRVGPFGNPFDRDGRPGLFRGQIIAETVSADGLVTRDAAPETVNLEILPSLLIEELQPVNAQCKAPALRALAGLPYRLKIRAVGIRPVRYEYVVDDVDGRSGAVSFEHTYGADQPVTEDGLGEDEPVVFNPVPDDKQFAISVIRVVAYDAQGRSVETALPITVHRPMEVGYGGKIELAERYEPEAVSGCIPGGIHTEVEYSETHTEERQQTVSVTVSTNFMEEIGQSQARDWTQGISTGESRSHTLGGSDWEGDTATQTYDVSYDHSDANNVGFSSSDGEDWSWDMSQGQDFEQYAERMNALFGEASASATIGASAEGSIPGFAKVTGSVETTAGVMAGSRTEATSGNRQGVSTNRGWSTGGSQDQSRSFGSTTTDDRSQSIGGSYALGRTHERSHENMDAREQSQTWELGQGTSMDQTVQRGITDAEEQTWTSSTSIATEQHFSGVIPNGRWGIFYRQTTRWVRRAEVRAYDLCGLATHLGELQFNEWTWAPGLALANDCNEKAPPPTLPPARCFIPPCGD
jgi:hypothetical protein